MAKKKVKSKLTDWEQTLTALIQSKQPGVFVQTIEEMRVFTSLTRVAQRVSSQKYGLYNITHWSTVRTTVIDVQNTGKINDEGQQEFHEVVTKFMTPTKTVETKDGNGQPVDMEIHAPGILVLSDIEPWLEADAHNVRLLRDAVHRIQKFALSKCIVILGKPFALPEEISSNFSILPYKLPNVKTLTSVLIDLFQRMYEANQDMEQIEYDENAIKDFARVCAGLTEHEARSILTLAIVKYRAVDERAVKLGLEEKAKIVRRSNTLTVREAKRSLDDVGGLHNLKDWVSKVTPNIKNPDFARAYGSRPPSGILATGIPGSGKSLMAEALANFWSLPLLVFDVGSAFGGLVGESERNIRQMIGMAEAMAPCVLWVDEIEKGLGGDSLDGGTTSRVKQTLLTWLNDKPDDVIVYATANDLNKLNQTPELLRAGRFDQIFFVDLPDFKSRMQILDIHLSRAGHPMDKEELEQAAELSKGYSGSELEAAVQEALRTALSQDPVPDHPTLEMLLEGIKGQVPLGQTMKESVDRLRVWCKDGRAKPAGHTLEDDEADMVTYQQSPYVLLDNEEEE